MKNLIYYLTAYFLMLSCTDKHQKTITNLKTQNDSLQKGIDSLSKLYKQSLLKNSRNIRYFWSISTLADSALNLEAKLGTEENFINYFLEFPYDTLVSRDNKIFPLNLKSPELSARLDKGIEGFFPFNVFPNIVAWYSARIFPQSSLWEEYHTQAKYLPNAHNSHQQITAYFLHSFNRSPENIEKYFEKYETTIYQMIDKELYQIMEAENVVNELLSTHVYLLKNDYLELFKEFDKQHNENTYFLTTPEGQEFMTQSKNIINFKWYYTFWYRRYLEGNMEIVHKILKKIKEHYDKEEIIVKGEIIAIEKWEELSKITVQTSNGKIYIAEVAPKHTTQFNSIQMGKNVSIKGNIYFLAHYTDEGKQITEKLHIRVENLDLL